MADSSRARTLKKAPQWWLDAIGTKFEQRHEAEKLTKRALAQRFGVTEFKIGRCMTGETPDIELIIKLSTYFDVPSPVAVSELPEQIEGPAPVDVDPRAALVRRNLRRLRERAGFDIGGLSDATNIGSETLESYEHGIEKIPYTDLELIASAMGHDVEHFRLEGDLPSTRLGPGEVLWFRRRLRESLPPDQRRKAQEITERFNAEMTSELAPPSKEARTLKKAQAAAFQKAKSRRKAK